MSTFFSKFFSKPFPNSSGFALLVLAVIPVLLSYVERLRERLGRSKDVSEGQVA